MYAGIVVYHAGMAHEASRLDQQILGTVWVQGIEYGSSRRGANAFDL